MAEPTGTAPDPNDPRSAGRKTKAGGIVSQFKAAPRWVKITMPGLLASVVLFKAAPRWVKVALVVAFLVIGAAISGSKHKTNDGATRSSAPAASPHAAPAPPNLKGDPQVDAHTRAYMDQMAKCATFVGLLQLDIKHGASNPVKLADSATSARDVCDGIRSRLLTMTTDHFDDQAALGWNAVDRWKSGLNAFLTYIDTQQPTKIIEVRNKWREADADYTGAIREINQRRHVYGLGSYHPGGTATSPVKRASKPTPTGSNPETLAKTGFNGTWPFTVDSGQLACQMQDVYGTGAGPVITFSANGKTYGVNGTAQDAGHPNVTPIWKKNSVAIQAQGHGPRVSLSDLITEGLKLCGI